MKQHILAQLSLAGLLFSLGYFSACATGSDYPVWYLNPESHYPAEQYLTGVGSGSNRQEAEAQALADLAQIFQVEIRVETALQESYREVADASGVMTESELDLVQNFDIQAAQNLLGVQSGPTYVNSDQQFFAIVYLERDTSAGIYLDLINRNSRQVLSLQAEGEQSSRPVHRFSFTGAAAAAAANVEVLRDQLAIIDPRAARSVDIPYTFEQLLQDRNIRAEEVPVAVTATGEDSQRVEEVLRQVVAAEGFQIADADPEIKVTARFTLDHLDVSSQYVTLQWRLSIDVIEGSENVLDTFIREGSTSGSSAETARALARREFQDSVHEFSGAFSSYFTNLVSASF